jgi:hypothetical protein
MVPRHDTDSEARARANAGTCVDCGDVARLYTQPKLCGRCVERRRLRWVADQHKARSRRLIAPYRDRPCIDCGIALPPSCMDLDHVRGPRLFSISVSAARMRSTTQVLAEIAKCDPRCPTCHRLRHLWMVHPDHPYFTDHPPYPAWLKAPSLPIPPGGPELLPNPPEPQECQAEPTPDTIGEGGMGAGGGNRGLA